MHEALAIQGWEGFYVIVGTSAGALIGLQFVVLTLISESGRIRGSGETLSAFGTPNVVHFCATLLVASIMTAPWRGVGTVGVALAVCGLAGLAYSLDVLRRARRQRDYRPVLEDWVWHATFPILAYATLGLAGTQLAARAAQFVVAGTTLLLVFIGIHNAWDTVTYVMVSRDREGQSKIATKAEARPPAPTVAPGSKVVDAAPAQPPRNPPAEATD